MSEHHGGGPNRVYAGKSQEQRQLERYERLVGAGIVLIGDAGYAKASVNAICREAGLTKRYFYESFDDREALLKAVYLRVNDRIGAEVAAEVGRATATPDAMVRAGVTAFFRALQCDRRTARILLFEAVNISSALAALNRDVEARFVNRIRAVLSRQEPHPALNAEREALVVAGLFGAGVNIATRWVLEDCRQPLEDVVESALLIYKGVMRQVWGDSGAV